MLAWVKKYKLEVIIFLVALIIRLILLAVMISNNHGDVVQAIKNDDGYYELSKHLIEGKGYTFDANPPHRPNPLRPPLYPVFLAGILAVTHSYLVVIVIQAILGAFIPVLGMHLARKLLNSERIGTIVGGALIIEPFTVLLSVIFYTETFFTFLFLLSLNLLFDYFKNPTFTSIVLSSVFLGLATLVKPTVQYLPVIIPVLVLWYFKDKGIKKYIYIIWLCLSEYFLYF